MPVAKPKFPLKNVFKSQIRLLLGALSKRFSFRGDFGWKVALGESFERIEGLCDE
jgi:hypothetical protein